MQTVWKGSSNKRQKHNWFVATHGSCSRGHRGETGGGQNPKKRTQPGLGIFPEAFRGEVFSHVQHMSEVPTWVGWFFFELIWHPPSTSRRVVSTKKGNTTGLWKHIENDHEEVNAELRT